MISKNILIKPLTKEDIPLVVEAFDASGWTQKDISIFKDYLSEQNNGERLCWMAFAQDNFAGYVTLKWVSSYKPFFEKNIPEIMDLNVLPKFRNLGIGSLLLKQAEFSAKEKCSIVGLGVGLYAGKDGGSGAAQILYVNNGYIPDGCGITYKYKPVKPGDSYPVDDDLILWFIKHL